jgi:hypothetical protein
LTQEPPDFGHFFSEKPPPSYPGRLDALLDVLKEFRVPGKNGRSRLHAEMAAFSQIGAGRQLRRRPGRFSEALFLERFV